MEQTPAKPEPSLAEVRAALSALRAELGSKGDVTLMMSAGQTDCLCLVQPMGCLGNESIYAKGSTWIEAIEVGAAKWAERADLHAQTIARELALAIIRITHETGACTDAQLRGADFEASDVVRYGDAAILRANDMAASGPFTITLASGANDVEAA